MSRIPISLDPGLGPLRRIISCDSNEVSLNRSEMTVSRDTNVSDRDGCEDGSKEGMIEGYVEGNPDGRFDGTEVGKRLLQDGIWGEYNCTEKYI